ncbi:hypothetical protein [Arthrobacter sp. ZGTC212]|uniref:hypothetical protein n=1 Tax=Arthrobacter sp. ZGTC212 TaxID=2058899 RepID=UPI000CE521E1|nr:hypothetical protein [Arthrobacter sp. ZGTC212]
MEGSDSFNAILAVIAMTRDARMSPPLACTAVTTNESGSTTEEAVKVNRSRSTWSLTDSTGGSSCDPVRGLVMWSPSGEEVGGLERADWMPPQIALFHPLQMRIWDGAADQMRVIAAFEDDVFVTLKLEHREAPGETGEAIINREFGVVTEYRDASTKILLTNLHVDL